MEGMVARGSKETTKVGSEGSRSEWRSVTAAAVFSRRAAKGVISRGNLTARSLRSARAVKVVLSESSGGLGKSKAGPGACILLRWQQFAGDPRNCQGCVAGAGGAVASAWQGP